MLLSSAVSYSASYAGVLSGALIIISEPGHSHNTSKGLPQKRRLQHAYSYNTIRGYLGMLKANIHNTMLPAFLRARTVMLTGPDH